MSKFKGMTQPQFFQQLEGAAIFLAATILYFSIGGNWLAFIPLLFLVDISCIGYLVNSRVGAAIYNLGHTLASPVIAILAVSIIGTTHSTAIAIAITVWFAHIGLDRMLGFGLKYSDSFEHTHLGLIGKAKKQLKHR